ncbi:MAG: transporter [Chromatocurvus sp.]
MPTSTVTVSTRAQWQQSRQPVLASRALPSGAAFLSVGQREVEQGFASVAARYGFAPGWELNARLSHRLTRWSTPGGLGDQAEGFGTDIGLSWLARPESGAPALLLDVRADLFSRPAVPDADPKWLDGMECGVTAYRSLDPVVLSLSTRYRWQPDRSDTSAGSFPTHSVLLAPQVNFAVNAQVTLVAGLSLQYRDAPADVGSDSRSRVATALRLGLGYAASRRSTLFVNANIATSGAGRGAGLDLEWLYRFQ